VTANAAELIGILIACGAAAVALVSPERRVRDAGIAIALVAAPLLVLGNVWDEPRIVDLRHSPGQIAASIVVGGLALAALVLVFARWREAFPIAAFAVLPLRVPLEIGGDTANLLVPLYLVIAAGAISSLAGGRIGRLNGGPARLRFAPPRWPLDRRRSWPLYLRYALAATLVLYAIQSAYSRDVANAIENAGFFLVPFAVMFALLCEVQWTRRLLGWVLAAVVGVGVVISLIAIYQYFARDLFLNPELADANELHVYFRVNSLFYDPNILGRYLALTITALGAYVAWEPERRRLGLALAAFGLCLTALAFSFSITSFAAALAGLGMVALLRWGLRGAVAAGGVLAVGLVALLLVGGSPNSDIQSDRGLDQGHADLIEGGLDLFGDRPFGGYGSGAFGRAFYDEIERARTTVSHSEPINVAAEQGVIGLAVYAAVLVISLFVVLAAGAGRSVARTAVGACFVAMTINSFGYTGYLIDPATWALLALGVSLWPRDPPAPSA
jgi:putative inorganic carbon (HCO3(-)) transporter